MLHTSLKKDKMPEMLRAPMLRDIPLAALLFLAGRASLLGMFPFGMVFFAACFDKSIAYIGITVLTLSLMSSAGKYMIVKYLVAALFFWIYTRVRKNSAPVLDAASCGVSMMLGGAVFLLYNYAGVYDFLLLVIEGVIAAMMHIVFRKAHIFALGRRERTKWAQDELISVAISAGVLITGLSGVVFPFGISLSDVVSVYAVLCIAVNTSLAAAGSGGLCIGFLSSMSSPSAVLIMGIFGMSALAANLLKSFGRIGAAIGFVGGSAFALLYAGGAASLPITLQEAAIGAALFLLTPPKVHKMISSFFSGTHSNEELNSGARIREYLTMRLKSASDAFKSLEECFTSATQKRLKSYHKDVAALFDETAGRVCEGCPNAPKCWKKDFTRTYRSIMSLLETMETKGMLTADNVPVSFREKCIRTELFVVEFNHVYELYKKNMVRIGEAAEGRDLVARQYREMSAFMNEMAASITEGFVFHEDKENEIESELDKAGITAFEVDVIEGGEGMVEVYLNVNKSEDKDKLGHILSEVLEIPMGFDTEIGSLMRFSACAKYSVDIGIRQTCRDFSDVSGDGIESFKTEDCKQYIIISDGMGSGKRAMAESRMTLKLLREFLMSGFGVHTSVDMINSALCLKLDNECFSTIDLVCIDLMTGVSEFFKIGSAESVVMHGNNVETVFSGSIPAGMLGNIHISAQAKRLSDGDVILMMSDGVSEAGYGTPRTDWIKREIQKPFDVMDDMAEAVIEGAIKKSRDSVLDDMTVAAVRLIEN